MWRFGPLIVSKFSKRRMVWVPSVMMEADPDTSWSAGVKSVWAMVVGAGVGSMFSGSFSCCSVGASVCEIGTCSSNGISSFTSMTRQIGDRR